MKRKDFQKLTDTRLKDADALLKSKRYAAAYYICGYIIECALKACIAKQTKKFDFPPKPNHVKKLYTHKIEYLLGAAGLRKDFEKDKKNDKQLNLFWNTVKDWSEDSRYESRIDEKKARDLFIAVSDDKNGILTWIKKHW